MFNKISKIKKQSKIIEDLKETIRLWIKANDTAEEAWNAQAKLVKVLNEEIELHEEIKRQDDERNQQQEEIKGILKEIIELKDIRIEQLVVQLLELGVVVMK